MPGCAQCGAENPAGARFCNTCGAAQAVAAALNAEESGETRKTVTVIFCDVTGSTALGERIDPEALRRILGRYFAVMKAVIERHGGSFEKFIGDAVMAVFGVPIVHEDDALRAVRAAWAMAAGVASLNHDLAREFGTTLQVRIGVDTGEVVTGTSERLATGDTVNIAARLEQSAAPGEIFLGEQTFQLTRGAIDVVARAPIELKGKLRPVPAYRLMGVRSDVGQSRRFDAPMVGRQIELGRLRDAFDDVVRERSCRLFTIVGPPGVGKTRLMGAFISYLHLAHGLNNFFVLAPNLTIYNKLITDFTPNTPKYVFKGIAEFATDAPEIITGDTPFMDPAAYSHERLIDGRPLAPFSLF